MNVYTILLLIKGTDPYLWYSNNRYGIVIKKAKNGKIKISPKIKSLVYKELQIKANETFEEITKKNHSKIKKI